VTPLLATVFCRCNTALCTVVCVCAVVWTREYRNWYVSSSQLARTTKELIKQACHEWGGAMFAHFTSAMLENSMKRSRCCNAKDLPCMQTKKDDCASSLSPIVKHTLWNYVYFTWSHKCVNNIARECRHDQGSRFHDISIWSVCERLAEPEIVTGEGEGGKGAHEWWSKNDSVDGGHNEVIAAGYNCKKTTTAVGHSAY